MIRILLAQPEATLRGHLARMLAAMGHEVVEADRGTAALPLLLDQRFDLLLADIVMPGMDGIELAQRCADFTPRTRIVFTTGFSAVVYDNPVTARDLPAVRTPFHIRQLGAEIDRLFAAPLAPAAAAV